MKGVRPDSGRLIQESMALVEKEKTQKCVGLGLRFIC